MEVERHARLEKQKKVSIIQDWLHFDWLTL
jgi:hypothetical protein